MKSIWLKHIVLKVGTYMLISVVDEREIGRQGVVYPSGNSPIVLKINMHCFDDP